MMEDINQGNGLLRTAKKWLQMICIYRREECSYTIEKGEQGNSKAYRPYIN